jgi:hypothetical protein
MSERLRTFLVGLASDPDRMGRFLVDPAAEIDGAGLSADEKRAVLARDSNALRRALGAGPADHMTVIIPPGQKGKRPHKKAAAKKKTGTKKSAGSRKMSRKK